MTGRIGDQWSVGATEHGMGQPTIPSMTQGIIVHASEWNVIINAINKTLQHQGSGTIVPPLVNIGDLITAYASIDTGSSSAYNGAGTTGVARVATPYSTTYNGQWGSSGARTLVFNQTLTFADGDAARYFFNAGGTVSLSFSHSGGSTPLGNSNTEWDAFATACGTMVFGYKNTTKTGGSGSTSILLNSNNGGYWNSVSPAIIHFKQFDSALTSNYIQVEYWWSGTSLNGGSPVLNFRTTWANVTGSLPNIVNGASVTSLTVNAPATTYITNTWGTPVFSGPIPAYPTGGTSLGTFCTGYDMWEAFADGSGGITTSVSTTNSVACGYISPPLGPSLGLSQPVYNTNQLTWSPSAGATSYNLYRGTSSGTETLLASGVSSPYSDTGLPDGTVHYYYIKPVGGAPSTEGSASNEVSGTTTVPIPVPPIPLSLTATQASGQVTLNWTASAGATSYNVYRSTSSGAETLLTSAGGGTSYVNTGLSNGTTYYYKVSAVNAGGESALSNEASATPAVSPPPSAPSSISASAGNTQNTITWSPVAGATSYNLYRSTSSGAETLYASGVSSGYVDSGLTNGTTYYYKVTAVNGFGESPLSGEASATPTAAAPAAPYLYLGNSGTTNTITWASVGGATSYSLYRGTSPGGESLLTGSASSPYNDTGLGGGTYYYKATATGPGGTSGYSNEVSGTVSTIPTATLAGSGQLYTYDYYAGTFTYWGPAPYFTQPGKAYLGEWTPISGDIYRQTGILVSGLTSTYPNYKFYVEIHTGEDNSTAGGGWYGPGNFTVTIPVGGSPSWSPASPSSIYDFYARSWYAIDKLFKITINSLTESGAHVYLNFTLQYQYNSGLGGAGTKDDPYYYTYAPCYLTQSIEFTKIF